MVCLPSADRTIQMSNKMLFVLFFGLFTHSSRRHRINITDDITENLIYGWKSYEKGQNPTPQKNNFLWVY